MSNNALLWMMIICLCLAGQGCSYRAWYSGFQQQQRQDCNKYLNPSEIRQCLDRAGMSYDDYRREREGAIERSK